MGRMKKPLGKEMGYRLFSDVNKIGRPKTVTSIPILLGDYRQLQDLLTIPGCKYSTPVSCCGIRSLSEKGEST